MRGNPRGSFRPAARVGCTRRAAMRAQDEWPPRSGAARRRGHTEPGLQAGWRFRSEKAFFGPAVAAVGPGVESGSCGYESKGDGGARGLRPAARTGAIWWRPGVFDFIPDTQQISQVFSQALTPTFFLGAVAAFVSQMG